MKKLFTLVALLACFLGAKAEWVDDYSVDYSKYNGFPFYVMGYVPEWFDGVMTDFGSMYKYVEVKDDAEETSDVIVTTNNGVQYYKIALESEGWHQYFIADGIPTEMDGSYTVKALVKASEPCTINVNMGWGWGDGQQTSASVSIGTEWQEVEWQYTGIAGTSCNLVAQPGTCKATIEWKSLTVGHDAKPQRPITWQEWLNSDGQPFVLEEGKTNAKYMGNAETPWADPNVAFDDQTQNHLICAWGKVEQSDPFPATIEVEEGTQNHVFVVHAANCVDPTADASAWDNQFWIQSPKNWKGGDQLKISFRYKCNRESVKTNTQVHKHNPSDYKHWAAIGDITFTNEWQEFSQVITWPDAAGDEGWSVAFNLNPEMKEATDFYFDDLSWQSMVLDEGYFVAGSNPEAGLEYDFDNAIPFEEDEEGILVATVGTDNEYVSQIMISTIRGNDAAFKSNTLKPSGTIENDPDNWLDYEASSLAKLTLPGSGIWKIYIDVEYKAMAFEMIKGDVVVLKDVVTNAEEITVNALEREDLQDNKNQDGTISVREEADDPAGVEVGGAGHTGQTWDNQFWIVANRVLDAGEATVVKFQYKATKAAKASTQTHGAPGNYIHWAAIGDVNFTTDWQDFSADFTIPSEAAGKDMQSIAFNLAEIKDANDYSFRNFQWYLASDQEGKTRENLINETGKANFAWKVVGGEITTGIKEVATKKNVSTATYNLAGQRVSDSFKGIVIKDGKKFVK